MATKWADGFEDTAAADLAADYTTSGAPTIVTGRRAGTNALRCGTTSTNIRRVIGGTEATVFQSCAVNINAALSAVAAGRHFMRFMEGAIVHIALFPTSTGAIAVYRGDGTTLLGTSASFFATSIWTWLQAKVVIHDTAGSVEIRDASGIVILSLTGIDTRNAGTGYCDTVSLGSATTNSADISFDDWHAWDATGSICNTWTNDSRIDHRLPTGPGSNTQFISSSGANYTAVDDATFNTTDYVESATAGQKDTYAFGDISHAPPAIFSVVLTAVAQKDDAGARALKLVARSGGTDYSGAAATLNQGSYLRLADVREVDPATGAAWTQTSYNAAEIGFESV